MPTVNDAARITTRESSVWRTCIGCGVLSSLPPEVTRCPNCPQPVPRDTIEKHALAGGVAAHRYAGALGRIEAWAVLSARHRRRTTRPHPGSSVRPGRDRPRVRAGGVVMPFVNVIRGEAIPTAPFNVRTPVVRIPVWMIVAWQVVKALT
jgi:hypothetical protein